MFKFIKKIFVGLKNLLKDIDIKDIENGVEKGKKIAEIIKKLK